MLNWTTRQALASFIFTARATCYNSPKGTLGAVEMPWLKFVPLSLPGGYMMRGEVARIQMLLPGSPTWHTDLSTCFQPPSASEWGSHKMFPGSLLFPLLWPYPAPQELI